MVYELDHSMTTAAAFCNDPSLVKAADENIAPQTGPRTTVSNPLAYLPLSHHTSPLEISALVSKLPAAYFNTRHPREQMLARRFTLGNEQAGKDGASRRR